MYQIEPKSFGYRLTFGGFIPLAEMTQWVKESERALSAGPKKFGVFVDMRTLKPLAEDVQAEMQKGQVLYKQAGLERSVVVLDNPLTTMQFKRIAKSSGIYQWERYVDASAHPNWEQIALGWIEKGSDPDDLELE